MLVSYCVVNTNGREYVLACLEAIRRTHPPDVEHELLVLDNASDDGSAGAVRALDGDVRLIEREQRYGKADNDTLLLREARGRYCLLLNEDAELQPGATRAMIDALEADPGAAIAGAQLLDPSGKPQPCAWRLPGVGTAVAWALFLHKLLTTQSGGTRTRAVGWVQSSAMLVRREAAEGVGYLDPAFFVYWDETDFCKRLGDAGWRVLYVPGATAIHHEQLDTDVAGRTRRVIEYHRNRDLYMRKHHSRAAAIVVRALIAWPYLVRALASLFLPRYDPKLYLTHARYILLPARGEGVREAAEEYNRRRAAPAGAQGAVAAR